MKKLLIIIGIIFIFSGCKSNTKIVNPVDEKFSVNTVTSYFKKISDDTVRIFYVLENTSSVDGIIDYVIYGALDYDGKMIANAPKKIDMEIKSHEQKVIIVDLNVGDKIAEKIYLAPFYNNDEPIDIKKADYQINDVDITNNISSLEFSETDYSKFNIELDNKNISGTKLKLEVNSRDGQPLCIAYSDINKNVSKYEFSCSDKLGEIEFVYNLFYE